MTDEAAAVATTGCVPASPGTTGGRPAGQVSGINCPKVYELADGRLAVRGDMADAALLAEAGVPDHESVVIVPRDRSTTWPTSASARTSALA